MPVENGRAEVEKRSSAGNANQASSAAPGKKRKKKKKEKCGESANGGAKIVLRGGEKLGEVPPKETGAGSHRSRSSVPAIKRDAGSGLVMAGSMKRDVGSGLVMVGSRALLRQNDRSSSNSSIEYSKPTMKVGRFDYSSSDAMSIGGRTSANSSGAMDVSTNGTDSTHTQTSDLAVTRSARAAHITTARTTSQEDDCQPVSEGSGCDHTHTSDKDTSVHVESLRWENQCSDEDEEKQRIEVYKENRRKRYEKALEERKARLSHCTPTSKVNYYVI